MIETLAILLILAQLALIGTSIAFTFRLIRIYTGSGLVVPFVRTQARYFETIANALSIRDGDVVYDLGSGDGQFLVFCARRYPNARFIGIERSRVLLFQAWIRMLLAQTHNLTFRRENFFLSDTRDATKMYAYLLPKIVAHLFEKRSGITLASRAFPLSNRTPRTVIELSKKKGWHGEHLLYVYDL